MKPKVSVVVLSYNQGAFIRQALDSFVMQKTNFPFEVLIHDDASTDGSADIIREYASKYPHIFRTVLQTENQWGKKSAWTDFLFPMVQGEYVAYCECDDYWTDENKLQKQADFLDAHPECSVCFHPVIVKWEDKSHEDSIFPSPEYRFNKDVLDLNDLIQHNFIQTNSVMYRWRFHKDPISLMPWDICPGDWYLHMLHAQTGKIGFIPDVMSVYRKWDGGIWAGALETDAWFFSYALPHIRFFEDAEKQFRCSKSNDIAFIGAEYLDRCKKNQKTAEIQNFKENFNNACNALKKVYNTSSLKLLFLKLMSKIFPKKRVRRALKEKIAFIKKIKQYDLDDILNTKK